MGIVNNIDPSLAEIYSSAKPFPHIILHDIFPPHLLKKVNEEWPIGNFNELVSSTQKFKRGTGNMQLMGRATSEFINYLNGQEFIQILEKITGIQNLIPDPQLIGGGLHEILPGGKLNIHADFNIHPHTKLDRRVNVLIYLNEDWKGEWGGQLGLWSEDLKDHISYLPIFGNMVIFSTTSKSYHGHPDPLKCPPDRTRRSIALYYYTNGRPAEEQEFAHTTVFKSRNGADRWDSVKDFARLFIPPIVGRASFYIKNRLK